MRPALLMTGLLVLLLQPAPALLYGQIPLENPLAMANPQTGIIAVEAESLLNSSITRHGRTGRQNMRPFGVGWSRDEQLFWGVAQIGAQLRLTFKTAAAGRYEVFLRFTRAPDYAFVRASFDGAPAVSFNGYAPTVSRDSAFLGMLDLSPGLREVLVVVSMKDRKSTGLNVGLDRIELRPVAARNGAIGRMGGPVSQIGRSTIRASQPATTTRVSQPQPQGGSVQAGPVVIAGPRLAFAQFTANGADAILGPVDRPVYRADPKVSLTWESNDGGKLGYRWQVASQPFPDGLGVSVAPPGMLREGPAVLDGSRSFRIDLGAFPPFAAGRVSTVTRTSTARTQANFYIRVIPILNGKPGGSPSNAVVARFLPGAQHDYAAEAYASDAERKKHLEEMKAQARVYQVSLIGFKPMIFADPNLWGCVFLLKNPYYHLNGHPLEHYAPVPTARLCGATYSGEGDTPGFWDVVTGWAKAYDIAADFYDKAKSYVAGMIAKTVPCAWLGSGLQSKCEGVAHDLASSAISAGLVAAGVPPTIPNLKELQGAAKGKAVDVAVNYTCDEFETHGGRCTPEQRAALAKAYDEMLGQIRLALIRETKEPGCGDVEVAHENGREPLPCFTKFPGADVRPATGAVTELPSVTARITRTKPNPPFPLFCRVRADLTVDNYFPGAEIAGNTYKPAAISGDPFDSTLTAIPPLPVGSSMVVTLPFARIKPFYVPGHHGGIGWSDWQYLYKGGLGKLSLGMSTITPVAGAKEFNGKEVALACADGGRSTIQIPK